MDRKRILRVSVIAAVAGATGFVMQSHDKPPPPQRISAAVIAPVAAPPPTPETAPDLAAATTALPVPVPSVLATPEPEAPAAAPAPCENDIALIARSGGVLDLGLLAPCRPEQRVLIRHGGLVITAQTSPAGTLVTTIPAFQNPAQVIIAFADGTIVEQTVKVADLALFDRFAVQWMGDDAFQLHAYDATESGQAGHIHAANPRSISAEGQFLSLLGDAGGPRPLLAQVFTWPAGTSALSNAVQIDLEAAVTEATCGREILGETLQLTGGRLTVRDLTIAMPECSAVGEFVVLPNPVVPEKLAAN